MKNLKTFEGYSNANLGIDKKDVDTTVDFLNILLSNHFVFLVKSWSFHWNVVGSNFPAKHQFFGDIYTGTIENIDNIAERIRSLGGRPFSTMKEFLDNAKLKEYEDEKNLEAKQMHKMLQEDLESTIISIREFLKDNDVDNGTTNFLEDMIDKKEKLAWMVRSTLK